MAVTIAVLTDVHGNAPALEAALAAIDATPGVAAIYCLGDMIAIGPDTNQVLEILFSRPDVRMILGNHEDAVLAAFAGRDPGTPGTERLHHLWVAEHLDPRFVPALQSLPRLLTPAYDGQELLMLHYHQDALGRLLPVDHHPSAEGLDTLYGSSSADAVFFGHHHPVHVFQGAHRRYVNPGSLGCCHQAVARYALVTSSRRAIEVALHAVPYDNRDFLASYERLQVPARELILHLFHGNQHVAAAE